QQQHRPRLDPPDGPGTPHALAHLPARRPQPAHPGHLGRPPGRHPPRRSQPAPENPAPAPQDPRQPGHRSAAITPAPPSRGLTTTPETTQPPAQERNLPARNSRANQATSPEPGSSREHANTPSAHENVRPKREDKRRSNVKTFWWSGAGSNCRPSAFQAD